MSAGSERVSNSANSGERSPWRPSFGICQRNSRVRSEDGRRWFLRRHCSAKKELSEAKQVRTNRRVSNYPHPMYFLRSGTRTVARAHKTELCVHWNLARLDADGTSLLTAKSKIEPRPQNFWMPRRDIKELFYA